MTDDNVWQSPSGAPKPPGDDDAVGTPAPAYGPPAAVPPVVPQPPAPPAYAPPAFAPPGFAPATPTPGTPAAAYGVPQAGWTPPPKPGLIPLRPLGFGTLLGASFQVIRRNPRPTFGISLLFSGLTTVLFAVFLAGALFFTVSRVTGASSENVDDITAGAIGLVIVSSLIPLALSLVVTAVLQGIIALEVSRATIGEKFTTRGLWRLARGRIGALVGWSALIAVVVTVVVAVLVGLIALLFVFGGQAGILIGVLLSLGVGLVGLAAALWLGTKLALVPSVLMLERVTLRAAVARSWSLTGGYFWRTLGILVLVAAIVQTAAQVVSVPISLIFTLAGGVLNPNADEGAAIASSVLLLVATSVVSLVFGAIATVTQSSVSALVYIDIRMRKEGLDLDLTRFVEARQVGDIGVANPYLPAAAAATSGGAPGSTPPTNDSPWA